VSQASSPKTANKILTTLTAIFKLAQIYGPLRGKDNAAALAERLKIATEDTEREEVLNLTMSTRKQSLKGSLRPQSRVVLKESL
jgi:hypothetical protein